MLFRRFEFAGVLAQLRLHEVESEFRINLLLAVARHEQLRIARFLLRSEQAVFIEPQAARDGALAHHDVVLLAAGEIGERERILRVAHHAQVGLNSAFQHHAGFRLAFRAHGNNSRLLREKFDDVRRLFR